MLVAPFQLLYIGLIKGPGHQGQDLLLKMTLIIQVPEAGVGDLIISAGVQDVDRRLQLFRRVAALMDHQPVSVLRLGGAAK